MYDYYSLDWHSLENCMGGCHPKAEDVIHGNSYYFKTSMFKIDKIIGHEAVIEVIASRLGKTLNLPVLQYTGEMAYVRINNVNLRTYVAKSKSYTNARWSSISLELDYDLNHATGELPLGYCRRLGWTEFIDKLIIFDYIIKNTDRHGQNIELLCSDTCVQPAPIFDNGRSLTYACGENFKEWDYRDGGLSNNFVGSLSLEENLANISKPYKMPTLTKKDFDSIFFGLSSVLGRKHLDYMREGILYRYDYLKSKGIIL